MLFDEAVQDRDEVVVTRDIMSFAVRVLRLDLPVLIQHKLCRDAVAVFDVCVIQVVL